MHQFIPHVLPVVQVLLFGPLLRGFSESEGVFRNLGGEFYPVRR